MVELLTADAIKACVPSGKTSFQRDLEVKDRKPDIVPKVGDKVKIKSREWYEKWKDSEGDVRVLYLLTESMAKHCGRALTVKGVNLGSRDWLFKLEEDETEKKWSLEMFEEVYPQELSTGDIFTKASDAIGTFISGLRKGSSDVSAIPAINPVHGIGIATDWSKLVSDTADRITLPQQNLFCAPGFYCQSLLEKEEPELQTIKKHRFIKLEKL